MSLSYVAARFLELKRPDLAEAAAEGMRKIEKGARRRAERIGTDAERPGDVPRAAFVDAITGEYRGASRELLRRRIADHDPAILEAVGWTPDALIEAKMNQGTKTGRPAGERGLDEALRSFIESEAAGHTYTEAVEAALQVMKVALRHPPDQRTLQRWLRELQDLELTTIPRP